MNDGGKRQPPCVMRATLRREFGAQVIADPASTETVAFGSTVTFRRDDGRVQKYRIVREDEADPKAGSISFVSPMATLLMGKAVGDVVGASGQELETIAISWSLTGRNRSRNGRFARPKTDFPQIWLLSRGATLHKASQPGTCVRENPPFFRKPALRRRAAIRCVHIPSPGFLGCIRWIRMKCDGERRMIDEQRR